MTLRTPAQAASTITAEITSFNHFLDDIEAQEPLRFHQEFLTRLHRIELLSTRDMDTRNTLIREFYAECRTYFDQSSIIRRMKEKPLGYAGDYLLMDWIYTQHTATDGPGRILDELIHRLSGIRALRNRKHFFSFLCNALSYNRRGPISVLLLGCGPCRDLAQLLENAGTYVSGSTFHCVDVDENALAHGKTVTQPFSSHVTIHWNDINTASLATDPAYDLIWSPNIIDNMDDRAAIPLIKKLWRCVARGGSLVLGNIHPGNPSRHVMEWCGEWFLTHRTKEAIETLLSMSGIDHSCISTDQEPLGTCIFGIAQKPR